MSNIIALFGAIIALVGLIIAFKKASNYLEIFKNKKLDALFGYYANLETYIERVRYLTLSDKCKPQATIYKLCCKEELREQENVGADIENQLKKVSVDFLNYLSSQNGQIPVFKTRKDLTEWDSRYALLIELLNRLSTLNEIYVPELANAKDVIKYAKDIAQMFDYFADKLRKERNFVFEKICPEFK